MYFNKKKRKLTKLITKILFYLFYTSNISPPKIPLCINLNKLLSLISYTYYFYFFSTKNFKYTCM